MNMTAPNPPYNPQMLLDVLSLSKDATAIYTSEDLHIAFVNDAMLAIWGKGRDVVGKTFEQAIPEIVGQPFTALLQNVWRSGQTYIAKDTPADLVIDGELKTSYFDFEYRAIAGADGKTQCILHTATDVTERMIARALVDEKELDLQNLNSELAAMNQELAATNKEVNSNNTELTHMNEELQTSNNKVQLLNEQLNKSEEGFRNIIQESPVAMLLFRGPDLVIDLVNDAMIKVLNRGNNVAGRALLDVIPELKGQTAVDMLFNVYATGQPAYGNEVPVMWDHDGVSKTKYFNFSYSALMEGGKITGVIDMAVDVTDQVETRLFLEEIIAEKIELEKTLRASEQRLQGILDTMAEGVGVIDATGQMVYANKMAQRILGLTESEIKDRTYDDPRWNNLRLDGSPLPDDEHPMAIMMRTGLSIYDQEIAVEPPGAERFYVSINAAPIIDHDTGQVTGGIGTFMDVTNRRKMMMQKDDFISVASHELKTPVTSLKASLQLLARMQEDIKPDMLAKLVHQSNKSLDKLSRLINELLDTNRISQGQLQLHKTKFKLSDMINDCCTHIRTAGTHTINFSGDLDVVIHADEQQLDQVLVNFINNAVKYAPGSNQIDISVEKTDGQVKVSVTDHGPGIPLDKKPHLFERYYRADYSGVQFSGLGLGLYICAEIIKKHGGKIGADSEVGKGSTFWFSIPL